MKTATSVLAVVTFLVAAVATVSGVNADRNPVSNHAHTADHSYTFQTANNKVASKTKTHRALRVMDEPKQRPLDDGKHHGHRDHHEPKKDGKHLTRALMAGELELINDLTIRSLGQISDHDDLSKQAPLQLKEDPHAHNKGEGRALGQAPAQKPAATTTSSSNVTPAPTTANKLNVTLAATSTSSKETPTTVATKSNVTPATNATIKPKTTPTAASSTSATKATKGSNLHVTDHRHIGMSAVSVVW
ncbi:hypothetical protein JM16_000297 [Phytophthora kernoviae]|uniref:RxLR effector protein n=1 Tax=Phytophthora kernoviae TaxID=325452 RepID=A0A8T0MCG2_9STRA|nr:hypothetical protein JM16_000297 [Phytophthora kernoviae]